MIKLLGSFPFIGLLGFSGVLILWVNSLKLDKTLEFLSLTVTGAVCVIVSWGILLSLVVDAPSAAEHDSSMFLVGLVLFLLGNAVGIFFPVWLGKLFPLLKPKYHFTYSCLSNLSFASGSIVSLCLKYAMSVSGWLTMMLVVETVTMIVSVLFVITYHNKIMITTLTASNTPTAEVSTKQLLIELFSFKRNFGASELATKDCEVSSVQFYLILLTFATSCALATTFMANLGPLLNADGEGGSFNSKLTVLVWASVGQTVGRIILLFATHSITGSLTASSEASVVKSGMLPSARTQNVIQLRIRNRLSLSFTMFIGGTFLVMLLFLRYNSESISFLLASTVVSGAYGCMWVVNNTFPLFIPRYNFSVLLSLFQFAGMLGMIICILIITLRDLDNNGVFVLLLIVAVVTIIVSVVTFLSRLVTEPKLTDGSSTAA